MNGSLRVVIVGANATGAKAAARVRRLNPKARITMLDAGQRISYAGCGLPYFISGKVPDIETLVKTTYGRPRDAQYFKDLKDVDVRTGRRVEEIDRPHKLVRARNLATNRVETMAYDKLVLAMGAAPVTPPIEGVELKGVHHLTRMEDAEAVAEAIKAKPAGSAVVIGAGFIGLEATEALRERGWRVTLVERYGQVLPWAMDFEMAAVIQEHLVEHGAQVVLNTEKTRIVGGENGHVHAVAVGDDEYAADLVILGTGMKPNVDLARAAGLEIGKTGAIAVNEFLQTSDADIYAGGDVAEVLHIVSGKKCFIPLGSSANKHGRVIGDNVCGLNNSYPGVLGTFVCKVFDFTVGSTGLSEKAAREANFDAFALATAGFDKAHYYPGAQILGLKLVVERGTGRLLGLQAIGRGDVARRIDVAATAIRFKASIDDLAELDLCYAPPYAQAQDCLIIAANAAKNLGANLLKPVNAMQTRALLQARNDVVLLDVRSPVEFKRAHIDDPKVVNIPLDDLGARTDELSREKKILCMCTVGLRSFAAQRILEGAGFHDVSTVEGGMFLWPWKGELA